MLIQDFVKTVFLLVLHSKWDALIKYFELIEEILSRPQAVIKLGTPQDKPL